MSGEGQYGADGGLLLEVWRVLLGYGDGGNNLNWLWPAIVSGITAGQAGGSHIASYIGIGMA